MPQNKQVMTGTEREQNQTSLQDGTQPERIWKDIQTNMAPVYINPGWQSFGQREKIEGHGFIEMKAAQNRFMRFLPYISTVFEDTAPRKGVIESQLLAIPQMESWLCAQGIQVQGKLFLKDDAHLPVCGSVAARGGVHTILKIAEQLAFKEKILHPTDKYGVVDSDSFRAFYGRYNLSVSAGEEMAVCASRLGKKLGFHVDNEVQENAPDWLKMLLEEKVPETENEQERPTILIDTLEDEDIFFGHATAALRLKMQLFKAGVEVDLDHPLFVYIPCKSGMACGGLTYGLRQTFGDGVHCFGVETQPSGGIIKALQSYTEQESDDVAADAESMQMDMETETPDISSFSVQMMHSLLSGCMTSDAEWQKQYQTQLYKQEHIFMSPASCAGFDALRQVTVDDSFRDYLVRHRLEEKMSQATHIVWGTSGGYIPEEEQRKMLDM